MSSVPKPNPDISSSVADPEKNKEIVDLLIRAYNSEIETVMNYLANSVHLDGIHAGPIKSSLEDDIQEELEHAQKLAKRIKVLGGVVPGSTAMQWTQKTLQPPDTTIDVLHVIDGVIDAEEDAIQRYQKIVEVTDGVDYPTQDLCIDLLMDEQEHRREFIGYKLDYEKHLK